MDSEQRRAMERALLLAGACCPVTDPEWFPVLDAFRAALATPDAAPLSGAPASSALGRDDPERELPRLARAVIAELENTVHSVTSGNAPGHGHAKPGIWDWDSGDIAYTRCKWCELWRVFKAAVAAKSDAPTPATDPEQPGPPTDASPDYAQEAERTADNCTDVQQPEDRDDGACVECITHLAQRVARETREACAKVVDDAAKLKREAADVVLSGFPIIDNANAAAKDMQYATFADQIAAAIRTAHGEASDE